MAPNKEYFFPYQKNWITNDAKYSIWEKSRRIGATFCEAYWSVRRRLVLKEDHIFVSTNLNTSKEFLNYCRQFAALVNVILQEEHINLNDATQQCLKFPNGSRIMCVSSNPTALRGLGGSVTLDEFSWHDNQEELFTAAQPVVQWGGCLHIISSHSSRSSVFNQLIEGSQKHTNSFTCFRTTITDAVADGLAERIPGEHQKLLPDTESCRKAFLDGIRNSCLSDYQYKQEYLCEFDDASTIILPTDYDLSIMPNYIVGTDKPTVDFKTCGPLFLGVDIARSPVGDETVLWLLERGTDPTNPNPKLRTTYRTVMVRQMRGVPFQAQFEAISAIAAQTKCQKVCIEMNGIGAGLAEQVGNMFPSKAILFNTNSPSKQTICERAASWISTNRIALPGDEAIKKDLLGIARIISSSGRVSYTHSDLWVALCLALNAGEGEALPIFEYITSK